MQPGCRLTYSVAEAAQVLGIHELTIRRFVKEGVIRSIRLGRRVLIPASALDELLAGESQSGGFRAAR